MDNEDTEPTFISRRTNELTARAFAERPDLSTVPDKVELGLLFKREYLLLQNLKSEVEQLDTWNSFFDRASTRSANSRMYLNKVHLLVEESKSKLDKAIEHQRLVVSNLGEVYRKNYPKIDEKLSCIEQVERDFEEAFDKQLEDGKKNQ